MKARARAPFAGAALILLLGACGPRAITGAGPGTADAGPGDAAAGQDATAADDAAADGDGGTPEVDPACLSFPRTATRMIHLRVAADDQCEVFVNGADVGRTTDWHMPLSIDVELFTHPSKLNVIGLMALNTTKNAGLDRGVIADIDEVGGGRKIVLQTDSTWRASKVERSGWPAVLYDDSDWSDATQIASSVEPPWGNVLLGAPGVGATSAVWIWTDLIPMNTADKPLEEAAFFRRSFYFATDGTTIADHPACP